jgi:hypothetical protein
MGLIDEIHIIAGLGAGGQIAACPLRVNQPQRRSPSSPSIILQPVRSAARRMRLSIVKIC